MVQGEGLQLQEERMKPMDPYENEIYKFLGVELADGMKIKTMLERMKEEVIKRVKMLLKSELNGANLIAAINTKMIPVAAYPMNVCKFSTGELNELNQVIKRELRAKNMLGRHSSDERLYMKREQGGRGLKSMKDIYQETRLRVACYMLKSINQWIRVARKREMLKGENSIVRGSLTMMEVLDIRIRFEDSNIRLEEELVKMETDVEKSEVNVEKV